MFNRGQCGILPSVGVVWQSSNMVDYYVGVTPEEARPGRPVFIGHSAVNFRTSLFGFFYFTPADPADRACFGCNGSTTRSLKARSWTRAEGFSRLLA